MRKNRRPSVFVANAATTVFSYSENTINSIVGLLSLIYKNK
jgi:hypothetical protein